MVKEVLGRASGGRERGREEGRGDRQGDRKERTPGGREGAKGGSHVVRGSHFDVAQVLVWEFLL